MNFGDIYYSDFRAIPSEFTIASTKEWLGNIDRNTRVIISDEEEKKHYLQFAFEWLDKIKGVSGDTGLKGFLNLTNLECTPSFEADFPITSIPTKAVITRDGGVVGYFDASKMPSTTTRGGVRKAPIAAPTVPQSPPAAPRTPAAVPPAPTAVPRSTPPPSPDARPNSPSPVLPNTPTTGASPNSPTTGAPPNTPANGGKSSYFLNASYRQSISIHDTLSIRVNLSRTAAETASIPLVLAVNDKIDVVIEAKKGFSVLEEDMYTITVIDKEETDSVIFKLKPEQLGTGRIRLLVFAKGIELGHIDMNIEVLAERPSLANPEKKTAGFDIVESSIPDLALQISKSEINGRQSLFFRITAAQKKNFPALYMKSYGPVPLELDPAKYFRNFFSEIELLPDEQDKSIALRRLEKKGIALYEKLLPEEIQRLIWTLKDNITTIKIDSDEPWIPWEMCKMVGQRPDGAYDEGPFFCEAFNMTRWIPGHGAPRNTIDLSRMAMVVPKDSGLTYTTTEKENIESLVSSRSKVDEIPAEYNQLTEALESGKYTAWHFSGHGTFSDVENPDGLSRILLENGQTFTPEAINGKARNMGLPKPIVFLNACQIGKGAMELTDIGGWASQLLDAGSAAFIGAYWSVSDDMACQFATALYESLLNDQDLGSAVRKARLAIKRDGDPTWLAYTVFTDPFARWRDAS